MEENYESTADSIAIWIQELVNRQPGVEPLTMGRFQTVILADRIRMALERAHKNGYTKSKSEASHDAGIHRDADR